MSCAGTATRAVTGSGCRTLSANRFVLGNAELRFPIPPAASAARAGALRSAGTGVRLVAAGFVFELDAVRPLDQPRPGWTFAFNFRPGF